MDLDTRALVYATCLQAAATLAVVDPSYFQGGTTVTGTARAWAQGCYIWAAHDLQPTRGPEEVATEG